MKFIIPGPPLSKARPRFARRGKFIQTYDPQEKEKEAIKQQLAAQLYKALNCDDKAIVLEAASLAKATSFRCRLTFFVPITKSWSQTKKNEHLLRLLPCDYKIDLDNFIKFYFDAMNEVIYSDDHLISHLSASKQYSENPRTEIEIMANKEMNIDDKLKGILKHFHPEEILELLHDCQILIDMYNTSEKSAELVDRELCASIDCLDHEIRLARLAMTISKIADEHGAKLKKIANMYPGVWKECQKIADSYAKENGLPSIAESDELRLANRAGWNMG